MPTPRPEMSRDGLGRREARREDQVVDLLVGQLLLRRRPRPRRRATSSTRSRLMPAPSSSTTMRIDCRRPARPRAGSCRSRACPPRCALLGHLDAVVGRVADHVGQRIGELLDHRLVDLGAFADRLELELLAGRAAPARAPAAACARTPTSPAARGSPSPRPAARASSAPAPRGRAPAPGSGPAASSSICWVSIDWVMTSSPTMLTTRSTLSRSTRIDEIALRRSGSPTRRS